MLNIHRAFVPSVPRCRQAAKSMGIAVASANIPRQGCANIVRNLSSRNGDAAANGIQKTAAQNESSVKPQLVHATHHPQISPLSKLNKELIRNEILQYWIVAEALAKERSSSRGNQRGARYCCFTYHDAKREYESPGSSWHWLDRELSSNLAGETGAVYIYKGALSALNILYRMSPGDDHRTHRRLSSAQEFCREHHDTEESHRRFFEMIVPEGKHTALIPLWKLAGYSLGFFPTVIGGTKALFVTIESVETFVEEHLKEQIATLEDPTHSVSKDDTDTDLRYATPSCPELLKLLQACCEDEIHHKEEAALQLLGDEHGNLTVSWSPSWWVKPWSKVVGVGSSIAAELARRV
mmetsp:Transcript_34044/g.80138  ORF Transcript_34044/g.80138 Transcript_34044/m.80138 type:complete len:352 (+) Transcript_34044:169-1224(+)